MPLNRREFLNITAATSVAAVVSPSFAKERNSPPVSKIRAIAFDGFVIFDPGSVVQRVESVIPGQGLAFTNEWRTRQFEYSWLRTVANQYVGFWQITADALDFAARKFKLNLKADERSHLMASYRELRPWEDVPAVLKQLRERNIRLAFLSNFSAEMLDANLGNSKLREYFQDHLSTDLVRAYKPHPRAYQMGIDSFRLKREEIAFAAFGGWDAVGAKWFGYPTVWVNRNHVNGESLGVQPDEVVDNLDGLLSFVNARQSQAI
jgi:2-haloacid dehalogenase